MIKSGGGSVRSYQYGTDLCSSLWALLVRGTKGEKYNVGSDAAVSIKELAQSVARNVNPSAEVVITGTDTHENTTRYLPSINKITRELNVRNNVDLEQAIKRTASWWKQLK